MTTKLEAFAHAAGLTIYLDTSAVLPLALQLAGELPPVERRRHARLTNFLGRVVAAGSRSVCSILVLKTLEHAVNGLASVGTSVEQPVVEDAAAGGRKVRKAHREYLRVYPNIDSMDALHIVFGGLLGCKHFISFDQAWARISEIQVLD